MLSWPSRIASRILDTVDLSESCPWRNRQLWLIISEIGQPVTCANASEQKMTGLSGRLHGELYKFRQVVTSDL